MEKTGERYGAARRVLIEQSSTEGEREWASEPEMADDTLREATARGWTSGATSSTPGPGMPKVTPPSPRMSARSTG